MRMKFVLPGLFVIALITANFTGLGAIAQGRQNRVEVVAKKFEFTPSEITLRKGEPVVLALKSVDTTHGIRISELGIDMKAGKGKSSEYSFTPDKVGTFTGKCSVFCGAGHGQMKLNVRVVE